MRDLDLLGTFLEVHRAGSLTAAAARSGLSQPTVSERLARLEQQLGEPLFERTRRGVVPTPAGDRLAARVAEPVDRLRGVLDDAPAEATGTVRIGGASDVMASRVLPALAPLAARGIRLEVTLGLAPDLLERLAAGALDLVVSSVRPSNRAVRFRGLVDEEFVLVGSPSLARSVDPTRLAADPEAALAHLPLIAYDEQLSIVRRYWRSQFGGRPSNPVSAIVPDLRAILGMVVAGAGISALPRYLTEPAVASGSVEVLHHPGESPLNTLYLAVPAERQPNPAAAEVVTRLVETARTWHAF